MWVDSGGPPLGDTPGFCKYLLTVIVTFLIALTEYLTKTTKGRRIYLGSQFEDMVHRGGEGKAAGM